MKSIMHMEAKMRDSIKTSLSKTCGNFTSPRATQFGPLWTSGFVEFSKGKVNCLRPLLFEELTSY